MIYSAETVIRKFYNHWVSGPFWIVILLYIFPFETMCKNACTRKYSNNDSLKTSNTIVQWLLLILPTFTDNLPFYSFLFLWDIGISLGKDILAKDRFYLLIIPNSVKWQLFIPRFELFIYMLGLISHNHKVPHIKYCFDIFKYFFNKLIQPNIPSDSNGCCRHPSLLFVVGLSSITLMHIPNAHANIFGVI